MNRKRSGHFEPVREPPSKPCWQCQPQVEKHPKPDDYLPPHDIDINDCVFERTGESSVRMLLLKGGHSIRYKNAQFRGDHVQLVGYTNVFKTFEPKSLSKEVSEALNYGVSGTLGPAGSPATPGDRSVPFVYGPR